MILDRITNISKKLALRTGSPVLGLIVTDHSFVVAETERTNGSTQVVRSGEYPFPAGNTIHTLLESSLPDFEKYLQSQGFKSRKAVVGIPARYLVITRMELPAIQDKSLLQDAIKIGIEKKLKLELHEISFDYCSEIDGQVAVLAANRKYVDTIKTFLARNHIQPLHITGTSLPIEPEDGRSHDFHIILFPDHLEIVAFENRRIKGIKQISAMEDTGKLLAEIRREDTLPVDPSVRRAVGIWNYSNHPTDAAEGLQRELASKERFTVTQYPTQGTLAELAGRLAGKAVLGKFFCFDFLRRHSGHHRHQQSQRKLLYKMVLGGMVFFVAAGLFWGSWHFDQSEIAALQEKILAMNEEADSAKDRQQKIHYARQWFQTEPAYLEVLRQLTLAFPESEKIWLSTMAVDESFNQVITGKTTEEKVVLDLLDNLKRNPVFQDIKILYLRKAGKNTEIITFAIHCKVFQG